MKCPRCKVKMKLMVDQVLNEQYYDCAACEINILKSIANTKINKDTLRIIKYS